MLDARIKEIIDNEWLGLGDTTKIQVENPFDRRTQEEKDNPHLFIASLFSNPLYFGFTCKHLLNVTVHPFQLAVLRELWFKPFPMFIGSRGASKSFMLALYSMLRLTLSQGCKIVISGSAFRQSKIIHNYMKDIWNNAPILRDICGGTSNGNGPRDNVDRCTMKIGNSESTAIPLGDGEKIRGLRANIIIADEFASTSLPIFENVVSGFAAVSQSPIEKVKKEAEKRAAARLKIPGWDAPEIAIPGLTSNQTILSGTCSYAFNHFYEYWKRYKAIIESRGDIEKLKDIFGDDVPAKFNWKDYSVIRLPVEILPPGFMDEKHVSKAKATIHLTEYLREYAAVFPTDSNGFYRSALINSCVVGNPKNPIYFDGEEINFFPILKGNFGKKYVMAVDPASERDNFSIVILELWPNHRRIVYCWTTTRKRYNERFKRGITKEQEYYGYCAKQIRSLNKKFPCELIAIDSQGGGVQISEALHDGSRLEENEVPFWPIIVEGEEKDTDNYVGEHNIVMINFANAQWVSEANHGMRKDFEDKLLLFPEINDAIIGITIEEERLLIKDIDGEESGERLYDTLEDCIYEIEELKNELATIVHSQTGTSLRDKWDTPEIKQPGGKKGRMRKDRYSALLMANAVSRNLNRVYNKQKYEAFGGFAQKIKGKKIDKSTISDVPIGPPWYVQHMKECGWAYGGVSN